MIKNLKTNLGQVTKPTPSQAGLGVGVVLLIISLLLAIGIALTRFSGDNPDGNKQKNKLDAATLLQQTAQLRNGLTLLNLSTNIVWTGVGRDSSGRIVVATTTSSYADTATYPIGPTGIDNQTITWATGSLAGAFNRPTVYAWTTFNVSLSVCEAMHQALGFNPTTPAVATPGLASASPQSLYLGATRAYVVTPSMAASLDAALGSQSTACIDTDSGKYRVVAKLNN